MDKITLELVKEIIAGAEEEANNIGVAMVISVVDDAWLASIDISQNKAWTSVALKMPTANLADATVPAAELYGLNTTNNGRLVVFGGGIPLVIDDKVVGAIGVSGSTVPHDVQVAEAGANVFNQKLM